jgi:hypothetical protein
MSFYNIISINKKYLSVQIHQNIIYLFILKFATKSFTSVTNLNLL